MSSIFSSPNPILFGQGVSKVIGEKLKEFGCNKVLVVYDKGVKAAGIVDKILGYIHEAGIKTVCYDGVLADPPDYTINEAGALGVAEKVDSVVAVGGGSSLDTGKGARVLLSNPAPISRYYARPDSPPPLNQSPLKPIIVVPTTSGTGSESTPGAVITDTENNCKQIIICPISLGIVDPELALGLPADITTATALDALCHSIEALTSRTPNRFSETLGKEVVTLISKYLPIAYKDGSNLEAREGLQLAATLAGMSILGPFCHIPHDLGQPLGAIFHIPHGIACAATLAESMKFVAPDVPDKVRLVAECMGAIVPSKASSEEIGNIAYDSIRKLTNEVNLPGLKAFINTKEELLIAVPDILKAAFFMFSPSSVTPEDVKEILDKAYDA